MKFQTFRLEFSPGTELPKKILVGKWGLNKSVHGDYTINETTARELPLNLKSVNFDTVDLDFEHNTVPGSDTFKAEKEPRKRAAFGKLEVVNGEGVYLHTSENWTPDGKDAVNGKHFQDLSPAILVNSKNEVVFIHSVALARHGATKDLELQLNSSSPLLALFKSEPPMLDYKKLLLSVLGLTETASDTQITEKVKTEAGADVGPGELKTMSATLATLRGEVDVLKKGVETAAEKSEREGLIARALAAGKILTQSAQKMPLDLLKAHIEELPADQVPMDKRTPEGVKTHSSGTVNVNPVRSEIMQAMGITKDQWEKHNGKS